MRQREREKGTEKVMESESDNLKCTITLQRSEIQESVPTHSFKARMNFFEPIFNLRFQVLEYPSARRLFFMFWKLLGAVTSGRSDIFGYSF